MDPVQQWKPSEASPSGIAITDDAIFVANLRGERLREVPLSDPSTSTEHFVGDLAASETSPLPRMARCGCSLTTLMGAETRPPMTTVYSASTSTNYVGAQRLE